MSKRKRTKQQQSKADCRRKKTMKKWREATPTPFADIKKMRRLFNEYGQPIADIVVPAAKLTDVRLPVEGIGTITMRSMTPDMLEGIRKEIERLSHRPAFPISKWTCPDHPDRNCAGPGSCIKRGGTGYYLPGSSTFRCPWLEMCKKEEKTVHEEQMNAANRSPVDEFTIEWEDTNAVPRRVRNIYADGTKHSWRMPTWEETRQRRIAELIPTDGKDDAKEVEEALDSIDKAEKERDQFGPLVTVADLERVGVSKDRAEEMLDQINPEFLTAKDFIVQRINPFYGAPVDGDVEQFYPMCFEDALDRTLNELRQVMVNRQRKYGSENITEMGEYGVAVRFRDKANRLKNAYFTSDGKPRTEPVDIHVDDSLDDGWIDAANYGVIALMLRHSIWGLPLKENV